MNSQKNFTNKIKPDIEHASAYVVHTMKVPAISDETIIKLSLHFIISYQAATRHFMA